MDDIKIGIPGLIVQGDHKGWYLFVQDDDANTGGYLLHISPDLNFRSSKEGGDYWAEKDKLPVFFSESKWHIQWFLPPA
jgi:hypothetical protein